MILYAPQPTRGEIFFIIIVIIIGEGGRHFTAIMMTFVERYSTKLFKYFIALHCSDDFYEKNVESSVNLRFCKE